jgi:hypothetical protein
MIPVCKSEMRRDICITTDGVAYSCQLPLRGQINQLARSNATRLHATSSTPGLRATEVDSIVTADFATCHHNTCRAQAVMDSYSPLPISSAARPPLHAYASITSDVDVCRQIHRVQNVSAVTRSACPAETTSSRRCLLYQCLNPTWHNRNSSALAAASPN